MNASGPEKQKILILGGTGFLGPALVEASRARGHTITIFHRGKTNPTLFPDIEKLYGERDGSLQALQGRRWDAVIDTCGFFPQVVKKSAELLAPNVGRYVFVSSVSVYRDIDQPGVNEETPTKSLENPEKADKRKNYGELKAACEQMIAGIFQNRSLIVRPGLIVGPGDVTDRFTYWPTRIALGGEVLAPGDGADPVQFIDVRDLAAFMVHLIEGGITGILNAVGPVQSMTMKDLLETCRRELNNDARLVWVHETFLHQKNLAPWSDLPVWIPRVGESRGLSQISISRALAQGLSIRPLSQTIKDSIAWWRTLPPDRRETLRSGITLDTEREILASWKCY